MKFLIKKIYIISFLLTIFLIQPGAFAIDKKTQYSSENISNYFLGMLFVEKDQNKEALKHLNKVQLLKDRHSKYNVEFVRTLVLLEKFDQAIAFSKNVWNKNELFFEADLLLGLDYFIKGDYINSEKHFDRLNKISRYNFFFKDFIGNVLISLSKASQGDKVASFEFLDKVPKTYRHIVKAQTSFLHCYFDADQTQVFFAYPRPT